MVPICTRWMLMLVNNDNNIIKMVDDAKVKYICDIYDWDGKGEIDLFFLGDVMYALGLNITKKVSRTTM